MTALLTSAAAFGETRLVVSRETMVQRCVKVIKRSAMSAEDQAVIINEFKIMTRLDHPNVLQLYEYFVEDRRIYGI